MGNRESVEAKPGKPGREGGPAAFALPIPDSRFPIPGSENKNPGTEGERFRGRGGAILAGGSRGSRGFTRGGGSESLGRRCTAEIRDCAGRAEFKRVAGNVQRGFNSAAPRVLRVTGPWQLAAVRAARSARKGSNRCRDRIPGCVSVRCVGGAPGAAASCTRSGSRVSRRKPRRFVRKPQIESPKSRGELSGLGAGRRSGGTSPSVYSLKGEGVNRTGIAPVVLCILPTDSETLVTVFVTIAHN